MMPGLHPSLRAVNGFVALQALDTHQDNVIDAQDAAFEALKVWIDLNQDGKSQADELHSLSELGIVQFDLHASQVSIEDNGNIIGLLSAYLTEDGKSHTLADVWLQINHNQDASGNASALPVGVDGRVGYVHE